MRPNTQKRLERLEAMRAGRSAPYVHFMYRDGEDPDPIKEAAAAKYRADHGLDPDAELSFIARHIVSPEWYRAHGSQR